MHHELVPIADPSSRQIGHTALVKLRTEMLLFGLTLGPIMLLTGCVATSVAIFDPPSQDSEQAAVTGVGFLGLIAGVGFLSLALPQRWGAPSWLWKHLGWLAALSIVPLALMMMVFSEEAARDSDHWRARTPAGVFIYGASLLATSLLLVRLWWQDRQSRREIDALYAQEKASRQP